MNNPEAPGALPQRGFDLAPATPNNHPSGCGGYGPSVRGGLCGIHLFVPLDLLMMACNREVTVKQYTVARSSARAVIGLEAGGVLVIRFSGLVTGRAMQDVKREVATRHGNEVRAMVSDYLGAAVMYGIKVISSILMWAANRKKETA